MRINKVYRLYSIVIVLLNEVSEISVENFSQVMWDLDAPHAIPILRNLMRSRCRDLGVELQPQILEEDVVFSNVEAMSRAVNSDRVADYDGRIKVWKSSWCETLTRVQEWCEGEIDEYIGSH